MLISRELKAWHNWLRYRYLCEIYIFGAWNTGNSRPTSFIFRCFLLDFIHIFKIWCKSFALWIWKGRRLYAIRQLLQGGYCSSKSYLSQGRHRRPRLWASLSMANQCVDVSRLHPLHSKVIYWVIRAWHTAPWARFYTGWLILSLYCESNILDVLGPM